MNISPEILTLNNQLLIAQKYVVMRMKTSCDSLRARRSFYNNKERTSWSHLKMFNEYYYHFDNIPNNDLLGPKEDLAKYAVEIEDEKTTELREQFEIAARQLYKRTDEHFYGYDTDFNISVGTEDKELALAKAVIVLIREWMSNNKHKDFGIKKMELWQIIGKSCNELCPKILRNTNIGTLMNKVKNLPIDDQELRLAIIPKTKNNQNSRKVGKSDNMLVNKETGEVYKYDIHQYLIFMFWMNPYRPNKLRKSGVYDRYKLACINMDVTPVSLSTTKVYINKNRHWMSLERDGEVVFNDKFAPYISQIKAQLYCSLWVADWSGTKLLYFDENYNKVRSLYMLRIVDVATDKIVGWELVESGEPSWAVSSALKKAIKFTGGVGCGEFVTDNGGAWNKVDTKVRIDAICAHHRRIQLGNKQSNRAETYVKLLSEFARRFDNWNYIGFAGQHGSLDNVHNSDYVNRELLPNKSEAYDQIHDLVQQWNDEKGVEKPLQDKITPLNSLQLRRLNGAHTEVSIANSRGILKVFKDKVPFEYDLNDYDHLLELVAKHTSDKGMTVKVAFDENQADLYNDQWGHITSLERLQKSHSTYLESTEDTMRGFNQQADKKHQYKANANTRTDSVNRILEDMPYLTSSKMNGQAKESKQSHEFEEIGQTEKIIKEKPQVLVTPEAQSIDIDQINMDQF